jgi:hypothetical protein
MSILHEMKQSYNAEVVQKSDKLFLDIMTNRQVLVGKPTPQKASQYTVSGPITQNSLIDVTRRGQKIELDTSQRACASFGFFAGDRVKTPKVRLFLFNLNNECFTTSTYLIY